MTNLLSSFQEYDDDVKKNNPTYSGLLGLTINGSQQVEHPTRNGFVYFRFRDNLSEVVLAFNDKVSPVYGLPVVVERVGNNWRVIGRDTDRYSNWGSSAPYLPKHGFQHSFNRDEGTGGDVVLVYPDQFVPLLVYPSGSFGAGNLQVASYLLQRDSDFIYVGNTGTQNILPYKPTGSSAIMGLVYLDTTTGNPGLLINSGTPFNAVLTGTSDVSPYIPYPSSTQEPLYAFRLVSGTSALTWDNLYNARQFIGGGQGGSASTGTFIPTGTYMDLTTNQVAAGVKRFSDSIQIGIEPPATESDGGLSQASEGASVANFLWTWGAGFASFITGLFARGTKASPTAVLKDDVLFRWRARAYDGTTYGNTSVEIRGVADEDHNTSGHGTRLEVWATPTGTTTLTKMMTVESSGNINIGSGTYNINGVPVGGDAGGNGQCYLSKSGTNLLLSPYNGNQLIINSVACSIPDAGVTLAPPAVASTTYYIYAYMSGATMTLEQSTTAPAVQAGTGVKIKTGDATRTLVGMARTTAANAWADSDTQMFVLSYFNRKKKVGVSAFSAARTTTSTSYVEINTEIRLEFLTWDDEGCSFHYDGWMINNTTNAAVYSSFGIDDTTPEKTVAGSQCYTGGAYIPCNYSLSVDALAVGYHYITVLGKVSSGTGTWAGSGDNAGYLHGVIIG